MSDKNRDQAILNALIERFKKGNNILITGQAGTGKTYVLNSFLDWLSKEKFSVGLAGSTGVAAINIGGTTVHRMFGLNRASSISEFKALMKSEEQIRNTHKKRVKELLDLDIIVIDEVSMISDSLLELMDFILRKATGMDEAFGGKQLVFTGDFLQLPPINAKFAFESPIWKEGQFSVVHLTKVHRQDDPLFINVLSKIRKGNIDEEVIDFIQSKLYNDEVSEESTKLYSRNVDVDFENDSMLRKLDGREGHYEHISEGSPNDVSTLKRGISALETLKLKPGAKVMSLVNGDNLDYVNGSIGTVIKLYDSSVLVEFENGSMEVIEPNKWTINDAKGKQLASFTQIPLRLAYSITIHKSQGMTIDGELIVNCKGMRTDGQFYVAISRVKDPDKLKIINFDRELIKTSWKAIQFYQND